ncbi:Cell wall transcription factor ACE2 [Cytospora mali]|uniref:Cell wall transcription factor ACE2 n=1 Tax=Cytospora mali TaxID=578113 RepID=A0A194UXI8_CYTMA|nr:Cell wall transcription factor ACE2 [Valsa mali var. pyri (nom. inval.)]
MWSGSPLKFEHPQQGQGQGQDTEFNNFQLPHAQPMPSTPSHHRRGQSLSALHNLPRTPNNHQLRPPVYLQSPLATNPTGLMGVGDVFSQGSFNENMAYYSPVISSPRTALDNLNEEFTNFDLSGFGGPLGGSLFDSPVPSPRQNSFPFHNNPFSGPPESLIPSRTASPLHTSFTPMHDQNSRMDPYLSTPQRSPTRESFRECLVSTPEPSPTHHSNPLKESLLQARQGSPTRETILESLIRTPEPSPTRQSFSHASSHPHGNLLQNAPDLRPVQTPRSTRSPSRSRQSPSPSRRMRAHQRTQSLASINSVVSLADGDMEQYRVESSVKPEEISALIGETDPSNQSSSQGADNTKKYICKWIEQVTNKDGTSEEKTCSQFFERKENCKAHIQTHLDDRQYKCPYGFCGKLFVRSHDLRRHLRTHDVHKKWVCPCGRDFSRADALHRHQGRGNCIGAPPGTKRKEPAKRGRPPKKKDGVPGTGDTNAPPSITASDLSQPHLNGAHHPDANYAPMGGRNDDTTDEIDMSGMDGLPRMDMDHLAPPDLEPSPSPTRDGELTSNSGGLAPSPLEDELSPSPLPSSSIGISESGDGENMLCGPPGDEWLEDLIFIDDNFVENGLV